MPMPTALPNEAAPATAGRQGTPFAHRQRCSGRGADRPAAVVAARRGWGWLTCGKVLHTLIFGISGTPLPRHRSRVFASTYALVRRGIYPPVQRPGGGVASSLLRPGAAGAPCGGCDIRRSGVFSSLNVDELAAAYSGVPTGPALDIPTLPLLFDDIEAVVRVREGAGVPVTRTGHPPHALGGEVKVLDPDGNTVRLGQRERSAPRAATEAERAHPVAALALPSRSYRSASQLPWKPSGIRAGR
jgi:hypothetical protein